MGSDGKNSEKPPGSFVALKEKGNEAFKENKLDEALSHYLAALNLTSEYSTERAVVLKNRAAVYLKQSAYKKVVADCDKALEIIPEDPKALFRRCQALEHLERYEEAYRDARQIFTLDPNLKEIHAVLARLNRIVEERRVKNSMTENKVKQMLQYVFDIKEEQDKRVKAVSNLVVLCKEGRGADLLIEEGVVEKIQQLFKIEKNEEIILGCIRTIGQLCKDDSKRTKRIISSLGVPWFLDLLNKRSEDHVNASQHCLQVIINALTGLGRNKDDDKADPVLLEENKAEIDTFLTCLLYGCTSRSISALSRDAIIQLISRNVHWKAIDWANQLVKIKGLQRLLEVASELSEYKYESAMEITESTRSLTSVCLARIFENMYSDESRARYLENVDDFFKGKLITPELENKVRAVVALTTLLLGPLDIGNTIIARDGMMSMILEMANSDDELQQQVTCECIIAAATKKDKIRAIVAQGTAILKKLYLSKNESIKVRALVGLCKLGSSGGTDASLRPFADGSTKKLAEACKKFLISDVKEDMRRWAAEGLSYLTLDADVKEKLISDKPALRALFNLAKTNNHNVVYGVVTTFVNLVNAYDKQEVLPELVELAKFAKQHIPEEHELDDPDFVAKRCAVLVEEGVASALVALSKTAESDNAREMIARVFNTLASQTELRGLLVQQGAVKTLLALSNQGTEKGKRQAAQALARLGVSLDPSVAFSGQKNIEVIRPLLALLHPDCASLESFEALLTLCNLASMNETVRSHIVKEGGLSKIENMMFEEHEMLRRAATQVMTNLVLSPKVIEMYEGENDRTKFLFLLCGEEDEETMKAAAGAVAVLTASSKICCEKLFNVSSWLDTFHVILAHDNVEIQHRAVAIVESIIASSKELAEKIIETDIMEILMAFTLLDDPKRAVVSKVAKSALDTAKNWNIIAAADHHSRQ